IEPLVDAMGEHDGTAMHREGPTPVLVHGGPHVEAFGGDLGRRGPRIPAHHDTSALLGRPRLEPVRDTVVQPHLAEADPGAREHRRGDGGRPRTERRRRGLGHRGRRPTMTRVTLSSPPFVLSTSSNPPWRNTFFTPLARSGLTSIRSHPPLRSHAGDSSTVRWIRPMPSMLRSVRVCSGSQSRISSGRSSISSRGTYGGRRA